MKKILISLITLGLLMSCASKQTKAAEIEDIRRVLSTDCSSLPTGFETLPITYVGRQESYDIFEVAGMKIEISDTDLGPGINDSASLALHDSFGCGGIIHFRD